MTLDRPRPEEHDPYYGLYIDQAPDGDILGHMETELRRTEETLTGLSADQETFRYAADKWSLRQVVGHMIDTEWTFAYRGLCFARTDPNPRPGFDQDLWAEVSNADHRPLSELLTTFGHARRASLAIFRSFEDEAWSRSGLANGVSFTVRCMPYILVGHEIHHRRVMSERYLKPLAVAS